MSSGHVCRKLPRVLEKPSEVTAYANQQLTHRANLKLAGPLRVKPCLGHLYAIRFALDVVEEAAFMREPTRRRSRQDLVAEGLKPALELEM